MTPADHHEAFTDEAAARVWCASQISGRMAGAAGIAGARTLSKFQTKGRCLTSARRAGRISPFARALQCVASNVGHRHLHAPRERRECDEHEAPQGSRGYVIDGVANAVPNPHAGISGLYQTESPFSVPTGMNAIALKGARKTVVSVKLRVFACNILHRA